MRKTWTRGALWALVPLSLAWGEDGVEENRARKVRELLDAGGEVGHALLNTLAGGGAPAQRLVLLLPKGPKDAYLDVLVPIYERHLDDETLNAALAFFRSSAGRNYLAATAAAFKEWSLAEANGESEETRKLDHAAARAQCETYYNAVMTWKLMRHQLPGKLEDLAEPQLPGVELPFAEIRPDPWGRVCVLRLENGKPIVVCLGPDGVEGTDDDIVYSGR